MFTEMETIGYYSERAPWLGMTISPDFMEWTSFARKEFGSLIPESMIYAQAI
jgi:hypothetical protein